ncbi:hypothetical protein PIB30_081690 [Stylosanthes scabra]|uniref:Integrator complex subunit 4/Protein SIEL C-terminal Ig-like domain-containing protein n=1 Tax=Stylosanthes scabra TaxID=79078 RepID=A0ABU6VQ81_9FABA|nr:hypothetical protein [Stylosanthes scabra]
MNEILNPSTPKSTASSILKTLTHSLHYSPGSHPSQILKLITDLSFHHPSLAQLALDSLQSLAPQLTDPPSQLTIEYLDTLVNISGKPVELDDILFTSICLSSSFLVRLWMVRNSGYRVMVRPELLYPLLMGMTKEPYPCVREESLEALLRLGESVVFKDMSLVKGCYECGVQLLSDNEDCVRISAVRVVALWGLMLASFNADTKAYWSNEVFAMLCSVVRDMNMKVRIEVFNGLGKLKIVSKELLMQSLSKRVLVFDQKSTTEQFVLLASNVAGALVHGVEDEFFEVRKSVCQSLRSLTILSVEFAHGALNLLMDVINDYKVEVRLEALETMHHMAINHCLELLENYMHKFLDVLEDNSSKVRYTARKIVRLVKLRDHLLFKSTIDGLLKNLDAYPQDEADIFSVLSHLGRNHKQFVDLIANIADEVKASFEGNREFNSARMAALLVLSISAPFLNADVGPIPPVMFSFAVTFLSRIHCAFSDVMDRDTLLEYLIQKSSSMGQPEININDGEGQYPLVKDDVQNVASNKTIHSEIIINDGEGQLPLSKYNVKNVADNEMVDSEMKVPNEAGQHKRPVHDSVVLTYINYILMKLPNIWPKVQSCSANEVLCSLRYWKEELTSLTFDSSAPADASAFALLYLQIIKLIVEVWDHLVQKTEVVPRSVELEHKLEKLDKRAKELMSHFVGLSAEEEFYVLELILLTYTLRLCRAETCSRDFIFNRMTIIYLRIESLLKLRSDVASAFVVELGNLIRESSTFIGGASCSSLTFDKYLKLFSPKQFMIREAIRHRRAELSIPNNGPDYPLPFAPGLTAAIPCDITLHNISSNCRVWLRMCINDGFTQHVYLDLQSFEVSGEVRRISYSVPYYRTPEVDSFKLKVCIGLESLFENVTPVQAYGGPKCELVLLCKEKLVYLSIVP